MNRVQQQSGSVIAGMQKAKSKTLRRLFHKGHDVVACLDGRENHRVLRAGSDPLSQLTSGPAGGQARHFMIDRPGSVQGVQCLRQIRRMAYTVYGYSHASDPATLVGFNGAYLDAVTGHYPLGAGNRFYSPTLMRFSSPDIFSPFSAGGLNAYAYCEGDPINRVDPSANSPLPLLKSKFPGLFGFLSSEEGKNFRVFGRHNFGKAEGIQRFRLKIENGQQTYTVGDYTKPTLPMYVSEDGTTRFTALMFETEGGSNQSSLLSFDNEFRREGFSLQVRGMPVVIGQMGEGGMQISHFDRFREMTFDEAYTSLASYVTPERKSWLAPMIKKHVKRVRSSDSRR